MSTGVRPTPSAPPAAALAAPARRGLRGWPLAIVIFFVIVVLMNAVVVYLAVTNEDPVVESYHTLER